MFPRCFTLSALLTLFHIYVACVCALKASLGIDFGTSGVRSCLIDGQTAAILHECNFSWQSLGSDSSVSNADSWRNALLKIMNSVPKANRPGVGYICCSGTSSSALLYDVKSRSVTRNPRMYNFNVLQDTDLAGAAHGETALHKISSSCPKGSATNAATSTLAKLLSWHSASPILPSERLLHQADYCSALLTGGLAQSSTFDSDWHNALKLGFDVHSLCYPQWLVSLLDACNIPPSILPHVHEPGEQLGRLSVEFCNSESGYSKECRVIAGTTDSIAAFLAAGVTEPGQAVTSLGSTLAIKLLSRVPVSDDSRGIYSHRLGTNPSQWLVGGASNTGCAIFRKEGFTDSELASLSESIDPKAPAKHNYYPLMKPGERFPINDPHKQPELSPAPPSISRKEYLHGILSSIAAIEKAGYAALEELGADRVTRVLTAGGGASNPTWIEIRRQALGCSVHRAENAEAAYGAARLGVRLESKQECD